MPQADHEGALGRLRDAIQLFCEQRQLTPILAVRFVELGSGLTNPQIAARHRITVNTVKTQVSHLLAELDVATRYDIRAAVHGAGRASRDGVPVEAIVTEIVKRLKDARRAG